MSLVPVISYVVDSVGVKDSVAVALPEAGTSIDVRLVIELELELEDDNETVPLNPLTDVTVIVEESLLPEFIVSDVGLADMVKSGGGGGDTV